MFIGGPGSYPFVITLYDEFKQSHVGVNLSPFRRLNALNVFENNYMTNTNIRDDICIARSE